RVPARFSAVAIVAFAVLAAVGFAWVLSRLPRAAGIAWAVAIGGIILLEGQHGVFVSTVPFAFERSWDRVTYEWLRTSPPGATLELNITQQDDFHPYTTTYQLESLRHRHPIVNGYSGFKSQLQEWLGGPASAVRKRSARGNAGWLARDRRQVRDPARRHVPVAEGRRRARAGDSIVATRDCRRTPLRRNLGMATL